MDFRNKLFVNLYLDHIEQLKMIDPKNLDQYENTISTKNYGMQKNLSLNANDRSLNYSISSETENGEMEYKGTLEYKNVVALCFYMNYCYPIIMGWNVMNNPQIALDNISY